PLQVRRAQPDLAREHLQREKILRVEHFADPQYDRDLRIDAVYLFRLASKTRPQSEGLGLLDRGKEGYVLTLRCPRTTRWATIDAGRLHPQVERSVKPGVVGSHRSPKDICVHLR